MRQEREENSENSSIDSAKKDTFLNKWLAYRTNPQASRKQLPADAFLRMRNEEVKEVIVSTAKQCIAEHLQALHQSQTINLVSDSESNHHTHRQNEKQPPKDTVMMEEEESSFSRQNAESRRSSDRGSGEKMGSIEEEESESIVKGSPFRMASLSKKNSETQLYVQDVGVQVNIGDGQGDLLEIVDIRDEEEGEVIYVLQHNHITTYSRAYLEEHHILALIEYYQRLMHIKPTPHHSDKVSKRQLATTRNQPSSRRNIQASPGRTTRNRQSQL